MAIEDEDEYELVVEGLEERLATAERERDEARWCLAEQQYKMKKLVSTLIVKQLVTSEEFQENIAERIAAGITV